MKKHFISWLALVLAGCMILAGCGGSSSQQGGSMLKAPNESTEAEQTTAAAESVPAGMTVSVTKSGQTDYYATLGEAWKVMNENPGVEVTVKLYANATAVNGSFGSYKQLDIIDRTAPLILDLNQFAIDRGLGSAQNYGAVFCLEKAGEVTIKNGTITGGNNNYNAGGIFVNHKDLKVTLENLTIAGNKTILRGGGIYVGKAGELTVSGCRIDNNNADLYGGGIYFSGDTANVLLDGDSFTGNYSNINGGAIYSYGSAASKLTFKDLTITNNSTQWGGAGILWTTNCFDGGSQMTPLTLSGKIIVKDNTGNDGNNVRITPYPGSEPLLTLTDLSEESEIWIGSDENVTFDLTDDIGELAETLKTCFHTDNDTLTVDGVDGVLTLTLKPPVDAVAAVYYNKEWTFYNTIAQAWATANASDSSDCTFRLLKDWIADEDGSFDDNGGYGENGFGFKNGTLNPRVRENNKDSWLTVDLNGYTIDKNLYKSNGTNNPKRYGMIFYMNSDINMIIKNGTLTGGNTTKDGGAIFLIDDDINLKLNRMVITGNRAEGDGSAIYVDDMDSITFSTVDIRNNYVDSKKNWRCAVNLEDGDIYMYGKILICNNHSAKYPGQGRNNLTLRDYISGMGNYDADMAGSNIHLTNITTYFRITGAFGWEKGSRALTSDGVVTPQMEHNKWMFSVDKELTEALYGPVYFSWEPTYNLRVTKYQSEVDLDEHT